MASVLSAIQTQLVTDVETTSINKCYVGKASDTTVETPWCEMYIVSGSQSYDMTSVIDRDMTVILNIHGKSQEQVELASEELMKLWRSAALLAALRALSVLHIYCVSDSPAIVYSNSATQQPIMADIEFAMTVRYTA